LSRVQQIQVAAVIYITHSIKQRARYLRSLTLQVGISESMTGAEHDITRQTFYTNYLLTCTKYNVQLQINDSASSVNNGSTEPMTKRFSTLNIQ